MHADARIVQERIDASEFRDRLINEAAALLAVRYVCRNCNDLRANCATRFGRFAEQCRVARSEDETRSLSCEQLCYLETDAG